MRALHGDASGVLTSWPAPSAEQEALRRRYLAHLERHSDALSRECYPAHLTAGTLVLSPDGAAVLLNLHRKAGRWFHFGGHCEPGDATLAAAAAREAREESGLRDLTLTELPVQLSEHTVVFCDSRGPVQHLDVRYAALAEVSTGHVTSAESLDVRWWRLDDPALPELEPEMWDLVDRAREQLLPVG